MGREREVAAVAPEPPPIAAPVAAPAPRPVAAAPAPAPSPAVAEDDGAELRDIFLEEAREVTRNGQDAVSALLGDPADLSHQTTLRRAFHTLKGSSRMVGFTEFGEAAWAMEQMMNSWLAEQKPARPELLQLSTTALQGLGQWIEDIAAGSDAGWSAAPFRESADAMRLDSKFVALALPSAVAPATRSGARGRPRVAGVVRRAASRRLCFDADV